MIGAASLSFFSPRPQVWAVQVPTSASVARGEAVKLTYEALTAPPVLPVLANPLDASDIVKLRQQAVGGSMDEVNAYLLREFEVNWPQHTGRLVVLPYNNTSDLMSAQPDFVEHVAAQFARSSMGMLYAREAPSVSARALQAVRKGAAAFYHGQTTKSEREDRSGADGLKLNLDIQLPPRAHQSKPPLFRMHVLMLEELCTTCQAHVQATAIKSTGAACYSTHPDEVFVEQKRRLGTGWHEMMHAVSDLENLEGAAFNSPRLYNIEEVRASLFDALMSVRSFGQPMLSGIFYQSDRNSRPSTAYRYFNPPVFDQAFAWVTQVGVAGLSRLSVAALAKQADQIISENMLSASAVEALKTFSQTADFSEQSIRQRLSTYTSEQVKGHNVTSMRQGKIVVPYSALIYQFDLARLTTENKAAHLSAYVRANPLRPESMKENVYAQIDVRDAQQVRDINQFNGRIYGARACTLWPPTLSVAKPKPRGPEGT